MQIEHTLKSLGTSKLPPKLEVATEEALPTPGPAAMRDLRRQRWVGHLLLLPFAGLLVLLMRAKGYRIADLRALRKHFRELTRERGPLLICANHLNFIDSALLIWAMNSNFGYALDFRRFPWNLPAGDFFKKKLHFRVVAYLTKCLFIHRDGSKEHKNAILGACRYLLSQGESVMLFPEGRRSRSGIFDREHITFGVGKILSAIPNCRVLCVYMRGHNQIGFADYPPSNARFDVLSEVIVPQSSVTGRARYFDLASQVADVIQKLESNYFAGRGDVPRAAEHRQPTALVTGASSGVGRALARRFAKDGHNLVVVARDELRLKELAAECEKNFGGKVTVISADLSTDSGVSDVLDRLTEEKITIDCLVNNAGFGIHGDFADTDISLERKLTGAQIDAMVRLTKYCVRGMREKRKGKILNVASVYAYAPVPQQSIYAACKAFLRSFSESLANEVAEFGIQVTVVCPGVTQTEFRRRAGMKEKPQSGMTAEHVAKIAYRGLKRGKLIVIPGRVNRLYVRLMRHLPGTAAARLMNVINRQRGVNVA